MSLSFKKATVGIIVLAAGESTRMGVPKQLLPYQGKSLIRHCVQNALGSRGFPVVVVVGANSELIKRELAGLPVYVANNPHWEEGMASSIRCGLEMMLSVHTSIKGVVIMLCDQPFVNSTYINKLIDEFEEQQNPIVASYYGNSLGVPALFSRSLFKELSLLTGNEGAKKLIQIYKSESEVLPVPFPEGIVDIDTPEDYLGLQQ